VFWCWSLGRYESTADDSCMLAFATTTQVPQLLSIIYLEWKKTGSH
jgi:hypothetical protein